MAALYSENTPAWWRQRVDAVKTVELSYQNRPEITSTFKMKT